MVLECAYCLFFSFFCEILIAAPDSWTSGGGGGGKGQARLLVSREKFWTASCTGKQ